MQHSAIATSNPPQSPVAWSSFITGLGPHAHGIYDFLTRDPKSYLPDLSSTHLGPPRRTLSLGRWRIPLSKPELRSHISRARRIHSSDGMRSITGSMRRSSIAC